MSFQYLIEPQVTGIMGSVCCSRSQFVTETVTRDMNKYKSLSEMDPWPITDNSSSRRAMLATIVRCKLPEIVLAFTEEVTTSLPEEEALSALNVILESSAEWGSKITVVRYLCDTHGKKLNLVPALHKALEKNNTQTVELLLDKGADLNCPGRHGWTSLYFGPVNPHNFKLLLEAGADVNRRSCDGHTVLTHFCLTRFYVDDSCIDLIQEKEAVMKQLLAAGADVNPVNSSYPLLFSFLSPIVTTTSKALHLVLAAGAQYVVVQVPETPQETSNFKFIQIPQPTVLRYFTGYRYFQLLHADLEDLDLKDQCRKVIRKHLLTLDPHTNLFIRVLQLQMTNERPGLPEKLISYLLYEQHLEIDWTKIRPHLFFD